jgi:hypothetical protein
VDKEPFGFVDGISQPLFLESQITKFREQELGGTDKVSHYQASVCFYLYLYLYLLLLWLLLLLLLFL